MRRLRMSLFSVFGIIALTLSIVGVAAAAQATPTPSSTSSAPNYPVAIHEGTCDKPVAQPAWDMKNAQVIGTGSDSVTHLGSGGVPVYEASATITAKLDDVAKTPHVIAVHASPEAYSTIVACGVVAGPKVDGKLVVALLPVADSGIGGIATLDEDTSGVLGIGKDQIKVTAYVVDQKASAAATPAS